MAKAKERWLPVADAALHLRIRQGEVYKLLEAGKLKWVRNGENDQGIKIKHVRVGVKLVDVSPAKKDGFPFDDADVKAKPKKEKPEKEKPEKPATPLTRAMIQLSFRKMLSHLRGNTLEEVEDAIGDWVEATAKAKTKEELQQIEKDGGYSSIAPGKFSDGYITNEKLYIEVLDLLGLKTLMDKGLKRWVDG
jgi:hypothetical protein